MKTTTLLFLLGLQSISTVFAEDAVEMDGPSKPSGGGGGADCQTCVAGFDANGGCGEELNSDEMMAAIPEGCMACGEYAMAFCESGGGGGGGGGKPSKPTKDGGGASSSGSTGGGASSAGSTSGGDSSANTDYAILDSIAAPGGWEDVYCASGSLARMDAWTTQPTTSTTTTTRTTTTTTTTTTVYSGENSAGGSSDYPNAVADHAYDRATCDGCSGGIGNFLAYTKNVLCMTESQKGSKNCRRSTTVKVGGRGGATSIEAECDSTNVCSKSKMNTCTEKLVQLRGIKQYKIDCCCNTTNCNQHTPVSQCTLNARGLPAGGKALAAGCASTEGITYEYSMRHAIPLQCAPITTSTTTTTTSITTTTTTKTTTTTTTTKGDGKPNAAGGGDGAIPAADWGYASGRNSNSGSYCDARYSVCGSASANGQVMAHCMPREMCFGRMKTCFELRFPTGPESPDTELFYTGCCCGGNTTCALPTMPESPCIGKKPGSRPAECETYMTPIQILDLFDGVEVTENTAVADEDAAAAAAAAKLAEAKQVLVAAEAKLAAMELAMTAATTALNACTENCELLESALAAATALQETAAAAVSSANAAVQDSTIVDDGSGAESTTAATIVVALAAVLATVIA